MCGAFLARKFFCRFYLSKSLLFASLDLGCARALTPVPLPPPTSLRMFLVGDCRGCTCARRAPARAPGWLQSCASQPMCPPRPCPRVPCVLCGNCPGVQLSSGRQGQGHVLPVTPVVRGALLPRIVTNAQRRLAVCLAAGTHPPRVAEEMTGYGASQSYASGRDDPILQSVSVAAECPAGQPCSELGWSALRTPCVRRVPLLHDPGSRPAALLH